MRKIHLEVDDVRIDGAQKARITIVIGKDGGGTVYCKPYRKRETYYASLSDVAEMVVSRHCKRGAE